MLARMLGLGESEDIDMWLWDNVELMLDKSGVEAGLEDIAPSLLFDFLPLSCCCCSDSLLGSVTFFYRYETYCWISGFGRSSELDWISCWMLCSNCDSSTLKGLLHSMCLINFLSN